MGSGAPHQDPSPSKLHGLLDFRLLSLLVLLMLPPKGRRPRRRVVVAPAPRRRRRGEVRSPQIFSGSDIFCEPGRRAGSMQWL